jgi:hypothetical protein
MGSFEPYIPIAVFYPASVSNIMADPLAPFVENLPDNIRDTIQVADDAAQAGLATNYPSAIRQIDFLCEQAREIVSFVLSAHALPYPLLSLTLESFSTKLRRSRSFANISPPLSTSVASTLPCRRMSPKISLNSTIFTICSRPLAVVLPNRRSRL